MPETTPGAPPVKPIVSRAASARLKGVTGNARSQAANAAKGTGMTGYKPRVSGEAKFGALPARY